MDAGSKLTFFFENFETPVTVGWTETYWCQSSDLDTAVGLGVKYAKLRKELLGSGAFIKYIRASKVPADRVTNIRFLSTSEGVPNIPTLEKDTFETDLAQADLLVRVESFTAKKRRNLWLGCLPDVYTRQFKSQGIDANFLSSTLWKNFTKALVSGDLQFVIRYKTANGPPPVFDSDAIGKMTVIMTRKRNRGRPFNQYRGRRLA